MRNDPLRNGFPVFGNPRSNASKADPLDYRCRSHVALDDLGEYFGRSIFKGELYEQLDRCGGRTLAPKGLGYAVPQLHSAGERSTFEIPAADDSLVGTLNHQVQGTPDAWLSAQNAIKAALRDERGR